MLYDPRWEVQAKPAATVSMESLIAWLEKQNPATRYSYTDIEGCLLSKYFRAMGFRWAFCGASRFSYFRFFVLLLSKPIPEEMNDIARRDEWTYGAALKRARALTA
jgi:hypothetical protein